MSLGRKKKPMESKSEVQFAQTLNGLWFWQPKTFKLSNRLGTYRPDFYSVDKACFYEVIGNRQAFSQQRAKIEQFRKDYPELSLEVVFVNGYVNGPRTPRKLEVKRFIGAGNPRGRRQTVEFEIEGLPPMLQKAEQLRKESGLSFEGFSTLIGLCPTTYRGALNRGWISRRMAMAISQRFGVPLEELR